MPFFYNFTGISSRHESLICAMRELLNTYLEPQARRKTDYRVSILAVPKPPKRVEPSEVWYRVLVRVDERSVVPDHYDLYVVVKDWKPRIERIEKSSTPRQS